jgi:signal transduction histidine kinase
VIVSSDVARGSWLELKDSGPPIPDHALDKIFERFYRLDPSRTASGEHWGIGLALAQALCRTLSLSLTVRNRSDGWVSFHLRKADGTASSGTLTEERVASVLSSAASS